jgi:integrase
MASIGRKPQQTAKGLAWRVQWVDPDGAKREKWVYGKGAARAKAARITSDLARGTYVDDRAGKLTIEEVAEEWLASLHRVRPGTRAEYRRLLESRVLPFFGASRSIGSIRPADVDRYIADLVETGRRPETISRAFAPLRAVLGYAHAEGYIPRNPAKGKSKHLPTAATLDQEEFTPTFLEWPEVERLADRVGQVVEGYGLLVRLTAITGMRAGEVARLRIEHVSVFGSRGEIRVPGTKSRAARGRVVPILLPAVVEELAAYLSGHPRRGEAEAPVFYARKQGGPSGQSRGADPTRALDMKLFYRRVFAPVSGGVRFHDLRHTAASIWASSGVSIFKVARWLGHADIRTTYRVYADLFPDPHDDEAAAVQGLVSRQSSASAGSRAVVGLRGRESRRG